MNHHRAAKPTQAEIIAPKPSSSGARFGRNPGAQAQKLEIVDAEVIESAYHTDQTNPKRCSEKPSKNQSSPGYSANTMIMAAGLGCLALMGALAVTMKTPDTSTKMVHSTASNPGAVRIVDVKSNIDVEGEQAIVTVSGIIENTSTNAVMTPPVVLTVAAKNGKMTRYYLGTKNSLFGGSDRVAFANRLKLDKDQANTVSVALMSNQ